MSEQNSISDQPVMPMPDSPDGVLGLLRRGIAALIVFGSLATLGYWGHATGWSFLRSSVEVTGAAHESSVPQRLPSATAFGWCREHGIHECPLCHPEVAQLSAQPTILPADRERSARALKFYPRPENQSELPRVLRRLHFPSLEAVERYGLEIGPVWTAEVTDAIPGTGEIVYDADRVARHTPRAGGVVWRVLEKRGLGDAVKRGDVLALIDAAEVGKAKTEFLQSVVQQRLKSRNLSALRTGGDATPAQLQEADAAVRAAEIRVLAAEQTLTSLGLTVRAADYQSFSAEQALAKIQFAGLPETLSRDLDPRTTTANLMPLVASQDGEILANEIVAGQVVDSTKPVFVIADLARMWLNLHLPAEAGPRLAPGQKVLFRPDGTKEEYSGILTWVNPAVDERNRTIRVRATFANSQRRLRANMLGTGRVVLRVEPDAIAVPHEAVVAVAGGHVVFVRDKDFQRADGPKTLHVRQVHIGARDGDNVEIIAGLLPREIVITKGSDLLLKELLKWE